MKIKWLLLIAVVLSATACAPQVKLFPDGSEPLNQYVLEGQGPGKVLIIDVDGLITDQPDRGLFGSRPSVVQEVVSRLDLAAEDEDIGAVVLKVNTPGGTATASDILYHRIRSFREDTDKPVVVAMMDVAASGGYYLSLPADHILAHPTTITGSVGAVFYLPRFHDLLDFLGVQVEVAKSGRNKDMGSPFRAATEEEARLMDQIIATLAGRFLDLAKADRELGSEALETVATARILTADQALNLGLIDQIGYLEDALDKAKELAGLDPDAEVVVFRRDEYANDNPYNTRTQADAAHPLVQVGPDLDLLPGSGFYYLWMPGYGD